MALETSEEQNFNVVIRLRPPSEKELNSQFYFTNTKIGPESKSIEIQDHFDYIPGAFSRRTSSIGKITKKITARGYKGYIQEIIKTTVLKNHNFNKKKFHKASIHI